MAIKWDDLRSRFTGVGVPWLSVSWVPEPSQRKIAEEALTYIENRGIFYAPFEWEHPRDTYESAENARNDLTVLMQKLRRKTEVFKNLEIIRNELRGFQRELRRLRLETVASKSDMDNEQVNNYDAALLKLREQAGTQIALLAAAYELNVAEELDTWLQPPR